MQPFQVDHSLCVISLPVGRATDHVVARINLPGAEGNHGLRIDSASRRAYIACEGNAKLLVLDLDTKRVVESFDVGEDPDVLALHPDLHLLYVAGEAGMD